jgi:hypothetical protein
MQKYLLRQVVSIGARDAQGKEGPVVLSGRQAASSGALKKFFQKKLCLHMKKRDFRRFEKKHLWKTFLCTWRDCP